ncbi:MAG TPA: GAF domain-containing sensor histidine kinase [Gaiellaceae bacterium]
MATTSETDRLRALVETGIMINSELSLDVLLERIAEGAARVTGARYSALGVIGPSGTELERFVTYGVDAATYAAIGDVPRGRGILGLLIHDARPLRLHSISEHPRSVGFPPHHPSMRTFLGVPIILRGVTYGNLYLTEKEDGEDFTAEDEELVSLLAGQAAVAVENARLYESATGWSRQLESLNEVGGALVSELELPKLLDLVVSRLRELIGARLVTIALPVGDDLRIAAADGDEARAYVGMTFPRLDSKTGMVLERGHSERVDSLLDDPEVHQDSARSFGARTGLYVPLILRDRPIGVLVAHDKLGSDQRFDSSDLRLAEQFAVRAAVAVDLSRRVARDALQRVVEGQELERRRLARELHDETGQALTSILLGLKAIRSADTEEGAVHAEADVRDLVVQALQDVRRLAVELRPTALDDFGLVPALERLTETFEARTGIGTALQASLPGDRMPADAETVLYRVVQEALTNVIKHADARSVSVVVGARDGGVIAVVEDDGRGFTAADIRADALGVVGMRERLALVGGTLEVESTVGTGTTLAAFVPLQQSS